MRTLVVVLAVAMSLLTMPAGASDPQLLTQIQTMNSASPAVRCQQSSAEADAAHANQCANKYAELPQCVESGQTCVIGGTPCCGTYTCKGPFPNTTCK